MVRSMKSIWALGLCCLVLGFWPAAGVAQDSPCADLEKQISTLKQEIAKLRDANAMLVENLVNCGRETQDLRERMEKLKEERSGANSD